MSFIILMCRRAIFRWRKQFERYNLEIENFCILFELSVEEGLSATLLNVSKMTKER